MLYCGFAEQARHEHMSDEYNKDRYIISASLKTPPRYYRQYKIGNTLSSHNRTEREGALVKHN